MRVASYNIRKAVGLDWKRDADRIMRVLQEIDADVVVLQESDKRIGQRAGVLSIEQMQKELGYDLADLSVRPQSHGWHGNAILYRKGMMNLNMAKRLELPTLEPRGAVSALLSDPKIEVVGVHLGLTRRTRIKQLAALKHHVDAADHPVLIAGDFNAWRYDAGIADTLGSGYEMIIPGNSFHAARPVAALDRFILKGAVDHLRSHVHHSINAARASDHLPIVIDLDISKGPA